ncbi:MAG: glycoside hydrolase domain-containing protein [Rhodanobacter sp.]
MSGEPAVPALADIIAFGGRAFDLQGAYASLVKAAIVTGSAIASAALRRQQVARLGRCQRNAGGRQRGLRAIRTGPRCRRGTCGRLCLYPEISGRAELLLGSPLFAHAVAHGASGDVVIDAPAASSAALYNALSVDGKNYDRPWFPPQLVEHGGQLHFTPAATPDKQWGSADDNAPPSFPPPHT